MIAFSAGSPIDLPEIQRLLEASGLPLDGLLDVPTNLVLAWDGDRLVGVGAVEVHGRDGLLRSLAVDEAKRSSGLGSAIVDRLEAHARSEGLGGPYLLTETAEAFFARRGYRRIDRSTAPARVMESVEWSTACGENAVPMVRTST